MPDICCDVVWGHDGLVVTGPMTRAAPSRNVGTELSDLRVRFLRPDIATVEADARGRVGEEDRQANLLAVVLRNDGERLIHALHSMIPFKAPRP
jgi:hypothetical protein